MSPANMAVRLDRAEVPAGKVTFDITNDRDAAEVNEDAIDSLGEVSELAPARAAGCASI
jgi:hypothetical protein